MIRKELGEFVSKDKYAKSGRAAEERMAFYLRRFFQERDDIHVINGLRLEIDGDAAQIDHLVVHPYGMAVVESKSVLGKIQIKDDGQWIRWYGNNESCGMHSAVTQARLQAEFLRGSLARASGQKLFFQNLPIDVLVAISDSGVILWPKSGLLPEVSKADQVADRVLARIAELSNSNGGKVALDSKNMEKLCSFLCMADSPLLPKVAEPAASYSVEPAEAKSTRSVDNAEKVCRHCGSHELEVRYGYTYYFFCHGCGKNTQIKVMCDICKEQARIRKKGNEFLAECEKCGASKLYHANPAPGKFGASN